MLLVEFGTRNLQGIMRGVTKGELQQTVVSDEEISPIGIYTSEPWEYGIGEIYRMVYTEEGEEYVWDVELLDISETEQEEGYQMFFDLGANSKFFHSHDDVRLYELPRATGEALRYVTNASSGKADESPYSPFVWRGKENAWGNVSSLIWDVLFQATGNYGEVEPYLLTDFSRHDIALNDAYVYCYYDPQSYFTASQSYIVSFTPAGEKDWFLIPSEFDGGSSQQYFATSAALYPGIRSFGDAHLRVGGDYSTTTAVNHATYEIVVDTGQSPRVGARLVLGEGR